MAEGGIMPTLPWAPDLNSAARSQAWEARHFLGSFQDDAGQANPNVDGDEKGGEGDKEEKSAAAVVAEVEAGRRFLDRLSALLAQVLVARVVVYLQHQPSPSRLVTSRSPSWFGPIEKIRQELRKNGRIQHPYKQSKSCVAMARRAGASRGESIFLLCPSVGMRAPLRACCMPATAFP